jgi:hypothetical protein
MLQIGMKEPQKHRQIGDIPVLGHLSQDSPNGGRQGLWMLKTIQEAGLKAGIQ